MYWVMHDEAIENIDIDLTVELNGPIGLNFVSIANEIEDDLITKKNGIYLVNCAIRVNI